MLTTHINVLVTGKSVKHEIKSSICLIIYMCVYACVCVCVCACVYLIDVVSNQNISSNPDSIIKIPMLPKKLISI
jgi:hypothetical protein